MNTGIYTITNLINNKIYVGSTTNSFIKRKNQHYHNLRTQTHKNSYLQNAWNKYGEENFKFEVLEECLPEHCVGVEQYWINMLEVYNRNFGYNISSVAGNTLGQKRTDEQRLKMSINLKGIKRSEEFKRNLSARLKGHKGCVHSKEFKEKLSRLYKGRKLSLETKSKIKANCNPKKGENHSCYSKTGKDHLASKAILQYDLSNNFIKEWSSLTEASINLNIQISNISNCCKQKRKHCGGFIWKFKNNE